MSASFYDLLKFAKTGIASPSMTYYDKQKALAMCKAGFPVKTLTGVPPLTFQSDGTPLTAWSISGNMTQTGTPTPSAPIQPEECGDRTANLISEIISDKAIDASGTIYTNTNFIIISASVSQNEKYTFSLDSGLSDTTCRIHAYNGDTWIGQLKASNISSAPLTVTTPSGTTKLMISVTNGAASKRPMIVSGSTVPTSYIPYGWQIPISCAGQTQNIYLSEPLRKISGYGDVLNSDGTVTRKIKKLVLTGEETVQPYDSTYSRFALFFTDSLIINVRRTPALSTHYQVISDGRSIGEVPNNSLYSDSGNGRWFIKTTDYTDATAFKAYLAQQYAAGTPVTVWYVLATAVTEQTTVPTLTPAKGSNTLTVGTTLQPSEVSITGGIK